MRPTPHQDDGGSRPRPTLSAARPAARFAAGGALLLAAFAVLVAPQLGAAPFERAEIYFVDAARAMVESGDWLVPRYQGEPFFDKPILTYWLMAASMQAFGPTPGAARAVSLVAALCAVLATVWLGALLLDRRSALTGGLVLATTLGFVGFARVAMSDMLLVLWTTLAVALAVRAYRAPAAAWAVPLLGAALGLGFATKGPIALLVPGAAIVLLALEHRRRGLPCGRGGLALAASAFVTLGGGWFALVYLRLGSEPLAYFFLRENLERFAGGSFDVGRPLWFYLPAYLLNGLPWSLFLPIALWRLLAGGETARPRAAAFLALWPALVLLPLSLSRGKIDYYLLPLYPALSLLLGRYLSTVPWRRPDAVWARLTLVLYALGGVLLLQRLPRLPAPWLPGGGQRALLLASLATCALALVAVAVRPSARRLSAVLASIVAVVWFQLVAFFLPAFARAQPNRAIAADVARELRYEPRARLVVCSDGSRARRDVLFAARHAAIEQCDLWSFAASREPYLLLLTPAQAASLAALPGYRHVASYRYVPATALTFTGLLAGPRPGEMQLAANFATSDPEAERKRRREQRRARNQEWADWLAARAGR